MKTLFFDHLKTYRIYYFFNLGLFIGGLFAGCYYFKTLDPTKISELSDVILDLLNGNYIQSKAYVTSHLIHSLSILVIIYTLSLCVFALPILAIVLFYKSFQFGYLIAIYLYLFRTNGIIGILLTVIPYLLFEFIAYFSSFAIAYELSFSITITSFIKQQTLSFKEVLSHLLNHVVWSLFFMVISILIQIYLLPVLFKFFIT